MQTPHYPSHHPPLPPKRKHSTHSPTPPARSVRFKTVPTEEKTFHKSVREGSEDEDEYEQEEVDEVTKGGGLEEGAKVVLRVLSIHAGSGSKVAAAYYDPATKRLHVLEDTEDTIGWDLAVLVMEQWDPEIIIMSSKAGEALIDKVQEYCTQNGKVCELQQSKSFSPGQAAITLSKLSLAGNVSPVKQDSFPTPPKSDGLQDGDQFAQYRDLGEGGMGKVRMSMVRLGCWVNVDAPLAMSAAGGLLKYLSKSVVEDNVYADHVDSNVEKIESMQIDQYMQINMDALTSLAVFDYEPNGLAYSRKKKEALSIYTLLKSTVTYLGGRLLHSWLLRPLINRDQISSRHDAVDVFIDPVNRDTLKDIIKSMGRIKNVHAILGRLQRGRGGAKEWKLLAQAILAIYSIREALVNMERTKELVITGKVAGMLSSGILQFHSNIVRTIDFERSQQEERVCILPGVDEELDRLRQEYESLAPVLDEVARRITSTMEVQHGVSLDVQYFPQMGFFIAIRQDEGEFDPPNDWHLTFSSEDAQYFKNKQMHRLDHEIGDIDSSIMGREIEIEQSLIAMLPSIESEMKEMTEIVAELDCVIALARAADTYGMVRPKMVDEPVLEIHHGRHLLQENWVEQYIANDTMMCGGPDGDSHSMMVVTGANGSGKSAYGKQVALIVFMAQIGSFVPAESATIGVVDKIFTRMQTRESSSKDASAFMIDLAQVSLALRGATSRSLIVLDEFGKGTVACDGAGLLAGVIEYCLNGPCPRTIILTHFHQLFTEQFVDDDLPILHCHMKTELVEGSKDLVYLYRLTPGRSLTSNAAACALAHGLPHCIVKRAEEVSELVARFEIARLHDAQLTAEDVRELQQAEVLARLFLQWDIDSQTQDVMDILRDMVEEALGLEQEEGKSVVYEGQESVHVPPQNKGLGPVVRLD